MDSRLVSDHSNSKLARVCLGPGLLTDSVGSGLVICVCGSGLPNFFFVVDGMSMFGPFIFGVGGNVFACLTLPSSLLSLTQRLFGLVVVLIEVTKNEITNYFLQFDRLVSV